MVRIEFRYVEQAMLTPLGYIANHFVSFPSFYTTKKSTITKDLMGGEATSSLYMIELNYSSCYSFSTVLQCPSIIKVQNLFHTASFTVITSKRVCNKPEGFLLNNYI